MARKKTIKSEPIRTDLEEIIELLEKAIDEREGVNERILKDCIYKLKALDNNEKFNMIS